MTLLGVTPFKFCDEPDICKTRVFGVPVGQETMTLALFVLVQYSSVLDRQTDGRTDGHLCCSNTSVCIACYATVLVIKTQELTIINILQDNYCHLDEHGPRKHETHTNNAELTFLSS